MFETRSYLTIDSFKSPRSERAPTAQVTGKRVQPDAQIITNNVENLVPKQIPFEKVRPKTSRDFSPIATPAITQRSTKHLRDISNKQRLKRSSSDKQILAKENKKKQIVVSKPAPVRIQAKAKVQTFNEKAKPRKEIKQNELFSVSPQPPKFKEEVKLKQKEGELHQNLHEVKLFEVEENVNFKDQLTSPRETFRGTINDIIKESVTQEREKININLQIQQERAEYFAKKKEELQRLSEQVRETNKRCRKAKTEHKVAWGANQKKLVTQEREKKLLKEADKDRQRRRERKEKNAVPGQKSRVGLDYVIELRGEIARSPRQTPRNRESDAYTAKQATTPKAYRGPNRQIQEYMRQQKMERRERNQAQQQLAILQEKKKETRLRKLEIISRKQVKKFKQRRRRELTRQKTLQREQRKAQMMIHFEEDEDNWMHDSEIEDGSYSMSNEEDAEVEKIMQRLNIHDEDPYSREGRGSRGFGAFYNVANIGNSTQVVADVVMQRREESEDSGVPTVNNTMPNLHHKKEVASPHSDVVAPRNPSPPRDLDLETDSPQRNSINRRKDDLRNRLATLQRRVQNVKKTIVDDEESKSQIEQESITEAWDESLEDYQTELAEQNFEETLRNEAATRIQSVVRMFLVRCQLVRFFEQFEYEEDEDSQDCFVQGNHVFDSSEEDQSDLSSLKDRFDNVYTSPDEISPGSSNIPPLSPSFSPRSAALAELQEFEQAKKRESELEKLLEESKNHIEEQKRSALQQTLYAQQSFIEDLKKSKETDARKFHRLVKQLFGDQKFAVSEITSTFMKMLDQRYAHLAEKFCENRTRIQAALGISEEMTEDLGSFTAELPPAEGSLLMTILSEEKEQDSFENEDDIDELLVTKKQQYEKLFEEKQNAIAASYEKKLKHLQNAELDKMLDQLMVIDVEQEASNKAREEVESMREHIKEIVTSQLNTPRAKGVDLLPQPTECPIGTNDSLFEEEAQITYTRDPEYESPNSEYVDSGLFSFHLDQEQFSGSENSEEHKTSQIILDRLTGELSESPDSGEGSELQEVQAGTGDAPPDSIEDVENDENKEVVVEATEEEREHTQSEIEEEPIQDEIEDEPDSPISYIAPEDENPEEYKDSSIISTIGTVWEEVIDEALAVVVEKRIQAEQVSRPINLNLRLEARPEPKTVVPRIQLPPAVSSEKSATDRQQTSTEPGIPTDQQSILAYAQEVFDSLPPDLIVHAIASQPAMDPIEVLAHLQESEFVSQEDLEVHPNVLDLGKYIEMERHRNSDRHGDGLSPTTHKCLTEAQHIHNKMIFDTINESLDRIRRATRQSQRQLPWATRISSPIPEDSEQFEDQVVDNLKLWSSVEAGMIPRWEAMASASNGTIDETELQAIREERLALMLAQDIQNMEPDWIDYSNEEVQVKIDIGEEVLEYLINEAFDIVDD